MEQSKINRINELARKKKASGLTEAELKEQKKLREEYLLTIKKDLTNTLDNTCIEYPDGSRAKLKKETNKF